MQTQGHDAFRVGHGAVTAIGSRALFALSLVLWSSSTAAPGQCATDFVSGGPIATLRGRVMSSVLWDPDGTGPEPAWLVVGGIGLTGGDQLVGRGLIAHDGVQWRGLGFGAYQEVRALAVYNGDLIVAGSFAFGTPAGTVHDIVRRSGSTWLQVGTGVGIINGAINSLAVFAGDLYAGGAFTAIDGILTGCVAKWNGTSWSRLTSPLQPTNPSGTVTSMAVIGNLYVGGAFSFPINLAFSGTNLGRWDGTSWSAAGSPSGAIDSLSAIDGATHATSFLFAGGNFTTIGGTAAQRVARAPYAVTSWSAMSTGLGGLSSISLLGRTPFLGTPEVLATGVGSGATAPTQLWTGAAWIPLGSPGVATTSLRVTSPQYYGGYVVGRDDPFASPRSVSMFRRLSDWVPLWGLGLTSPVECLAADGPDVIAGGAFLAADNTIVNGIARRSGGIWTGLGSGMTGGSGTVKAVVRAGNGDVFAGGNFTTAGGNPASNVARWNGSAWAPLGSGTNGTVLALTIAANGDLIAGGDFTSAGGVICNRVARWNGAAWGPLAAGMDSTVRCLVSLTNGDIVAGGHFTLASGSFCPHIARWNGISWSSMAGGMNADVHALTLRPDGELVAGGAFTFAGGNPCSRLARWSGSNWIAMASGVPDVVHALAALPNGDVLAGGAFLASPLSLIARWRASGNFLQSIQGGLHGAAVLAFAAAPNGDVYIGGDFDETAPGLVSGNFVILSTNCAATATPVATSCVGPAGPLNLVADSLPWLGTTFRSTATGFAPQALAASVLGLAPDNLPLSQLLPAGLPNCHLLATTDAVLLAVPQAGTSHYQFVVPNQFSLVGIQLSHQFVQMTVAPSGAIQSLSSSNALTLVIGSL